MAQARLLTSLTMPAPFTPQSTNEQITACANVTFMSARERDAWFAIRGFVFQVERTIQRWLSLEEGEILELECGEDISQISPVLIDGTWREERVLEQVKSFYDKNVTLRDGIESLANFVEHRHYNRENSCCLRFCYTTNAQVVCERPPINKEGRAGLDLWADIASNQLSQQEQETILSQLRAFLLKCKKPEALNKATWKRFRDFLNKATNAEWLEFVQRFEWNTGIPAPVDLSQNIQSHLRMINAGITEKEASSQYERLFVHVFLLLSNKGEKQLKSSEWQTVIKQEISSEIRTWLEELTTNIISIEQRVSALEEAARRKATYESYTGSELRARVEELLDEHTGIFVGRENDIAAIEDFIRNNKKGILTITAEAGFGKTALLANCIKQWREKGVFVAYHLFNRRYEITASVHQAYRHLLAQVFSYYGLTHEALPDDDAKLRDTLYGILRDRKPRSEEPILIVIDALDEANQEFSSFPVSWPDGIYILVSGRAIREEYPDYLRDWLKGERLHLDCLSRNAMSDYFHEISEGKLSAFARNTEFLEKVFEKTEGYPLYLRFLAEELVQLCTDKGDVTELLSQTPKGFRNYVEHQFRLLAASHTVRNSREVQQLFCLLTVARGPLSSSEIHNLTQLTAWDTASLPWHVTRWFSIHPTENADYFYSFAHPQLAQTFAEILGKEAENMRHMLLEFCRRWHEHRCIYSLKHYADHLAQMQNFDELFSLAANIEFRECQKKEVSEEPELPLRTIRIALKCAIEADRPEEMAEFTLSHAQQIVEALQDSPLRALRDGKLHRAWNLADIADEERRILWHLLIAWELWELGQSANAEATVLRIWERQRPTLHSWKTDCAIFLLLRMAKFGEELVLLLSLDLFESYERQKVTECLANQGQTAVALLMALSFEDDSYYVKTLCKVAEKSAAASNIKHVQVAFAYALAKVAETTEEVSQSQWLSYIAQSQARAGLVNEGIQSLNMISQWWDYMDALEEISIALTQKGETREATALVEDVSTQLRSLPVGSLRAWMLCKLVSIQAKVGLLNEAKATALEIDEPEQAEMAFESIAEYQAQAKKLKDALAQAEAITDLNRKASTLATIAAIQKRNGSIRSSRLIFSKARAVAEQIKDEESHAGSLQNIAAEQAHVGLFDDALKTAHIIPDTDGFGDEYRAWTIGTIAVAQVRAGHLKEAFSTLRLRSGSSSVLPEFVKFYVDNGELDTATTFADICLRRNIYNGTDAWIAIAEYLSNNSCNTSACDAVARIFSTSEVQDYQWLQVLSKCLIDIAELLVEHNRLDKGRDLLARASILARMVQTSPNWFFDYLLQCIVQLQIRCGSYDDARKTALHINTEHMRASTIKTLERHQQLFTQYPSIVQNPEKLLEHKRALREIFFPRDDCEPTTFWQDDDVFLEEKLSKARENTDVAERVESLCLIAAWCHQTDTEAVQQIFAEALDLARGIDDEYTREAALKEVAYTQANMGLTEEALRSASEVQAQSEGLERVSEGLLKGGFFDEAFKVASSMSPCKTRVDMIVKVIESISKSGNKERAIILFDDLLLQVEHEEYKQWGDVFTNIAVGLAKCGFGDKAIKVSHKISKERNESLPKIAAALATTGDKENFKQLLLPCSYYSDASFEICTHIPRLYPAKVENIADIVQRYVNEGVQYTHRNR